MKSKYRTKTFLSTFFVLTLGFLQMSFSRKMYTPASHSVKSVRIRSYSGPYFPAFGPE